MLVRRWLDAAGISDPVLRNCYTTCVREAADRDGGHLRWWGLRAVPAPVRPHVGALAAMAFTADDYSDTGPVAQRRCRFDAYTDAVLSAIAAGHATDPVLHATAHTVRTLGLPVSLCEEAFAAMREDIDFSGFTTYEELQRWSAKSTGSPMVVMASLMTDPDTARRLEPALREFGELFQFMDVLCDLGKDLRDGRLYLPLEDLDRFGVRAEDLRAGRWTAAAAELIAFETARITHRLPTLSTELQRRTGVSFIGVLEKHCHLLLREVLAAGPALLNRSARPRFADVLDIWLPHWRNTIPGDHKEGLS
ncbi:phytoene/squalene synthase family protein [Streptomyces noursei]|uniref:phytoene/squalene synthase family protein n=1 Tax=Streptomyces noursei TaxID=1971 RepID=UPI003BF47925